MRVLAICSALLLTACGAYTSVIGPSRASISRADVDSIKQLSQKFLAGRGERGPANTMTLKAVKADEVEVNTESHGDTYMHFVAIRRGGTWILKPKNRARPTS
jgi:Tfp pilus assembly protein PilE